MNVWGMLLWDAQVCVVDCRAFCSRGLALVKCFGNNLWYLLRGIVSAITSCVDMREVYQVYTPYMNSMNQ